MVAVFIESPKRELFLQIYSSCEKFISSRFFFFTVGTQLSSDDLSSILINKNTLFFLFLGEIDCGPLENYCKTRNANRC